MKLINTYKGSSFKELIKAYSNARMQRDRNYRQGVFQLLEERKPKEPLTHEPSVANGGGPVNSPPIGESSIVSG